MEPGQAVAGTGRGAAWRTRAETTAKDRMPGAVRLRAEEVLVKRRHRGQGNAGSSGEAAACDEAAEEAACVAATWGMAAWWCTAASAWLTPEADWRMEV